MPSRWLERPAAERHLLEEHDNFAGLRNGLRRASEKLEYWAGIPMPLEGESLVVEPTYPHAKELMALCGEETPEEEAPSKAVLRNSFWSVSLRSTIHVIQEEDGRIRHAVTPGIHHLTYDLHTLGCCEAWGIEQESNAIHTLAEMVSHHQFKQYLLTGSFLESSKRSSVMYMFRRLKPTVAINSRPGRGVKIMCTLCMHPIAYYRGTWAGAMCPTDDVIASLALMRCDEHMLWKRSNQHAPHLPEAGL